MVLSQILSEEARLQGGARDKKDLKNKIKRQQARQEQKQRGRFEILRDTKRETRQIFERTNNVLLLFSKCALTSRCSKNTRQTPTTEINKQKTFSSHGHFAIDPPETVSFF